MDQSLRDEVYRSAVELIGAWKQGLLGGEVMPEDANPGLEKGSDENYLYFTLPMALNYQRNSYKLWQSAAHTYEDESTRSVFRPADVRAMEADELRELLTKYRVALQPNRHVAIWRTLCETLADFGDSVPALFKDCGGTVQGVKDYLQGHKKQFPYLSGPKIMNYWLYVMTQYTDFAFPDRENISVAPDTHVIQASARLGLIAPGEVRQDGSFRELVSSLWAEVFRGTDYCPIDVHTPLWLWSRNGFQYHLSGERPHPSEGWVQARIEFPGGDPPLE